MKILPITTETLNCQDCYKCIRECPLKAIKVTNHKASVIESRCVFCGHCVASCPTGAKQVRSDVGIVKRLITDGKRVCLSLAPAVMAEFPKASKQQLIVAFKQLGFTDVSETALGAQVVTTQSVQYLNARDSGVYISSACPSVVELIRKYYPQHTLSITPFMSPMLTHAQMIKSWSGVDTHVVFAGPCVAKKTESDQYPNLVDASLTFKDIHAWLAEKHIVPHLLDDCNAQFFPFDAVDGVLYPVDGGMLSSIKKQGGDRKILFMSFSGIKQVCDVLEGLDQLSHDGPIFLELLACEGGCINGPGTENKGGIALKRLKVIDYFQTIPHEKVQGNFPSVRIERDFFSILPIEQKLTSEEEIKKALFNIGKSSVSDELNCSGCGYDSCRDFAKATLTGLAEPAMCVSFMRKVAHNQANILLQKIPSGVVVVDELLKVVEMNLSCAKMLGSEVELVFEACPGLAGVDISKLGGLANYFSTAINTGKEYREVAIRENNQNFQLSIFNIQKHKLVTGIIQNVSQPQFNREIVEKRTRDVIRKNMETVQQIACLLGENASFTDSLLTSILEDHQQSKLSQ